MFLYKISFCPVSVPITKKNSDLSVVNRCFPVFWAVNGARTRDSRVRSLGQILFINLLNVNNLRITLLVIFALFCPDSVPKQNNKNNWFSISYQYFWCTLYDREKAVHFFVVSQRTQNFVAKILVHDKIYNFSLSYWYLESYQQSIGW